MKEVILIFVCLTQLPAFGQSLVQDKDAINCIYDEEKVSVDAEFIKAKRGKPPLIFAQLNWRLTNNSDCMLWVIIPARASYKLTDTTYSLDMITSMAFDTLKAGTVYAKIIKKPAGSGRCYLFPLSPHQSYELQGSHPFASEYWTISSRDSIQPFNVLITDSVIVDHQAKFDSLIEKKTPAHYLSKNGRSWYRIEYVEYVDDSTVDLKFGNVLKVLHFDFTDKRVEE